MIKKDLTPMSETQFSNRKKDILINLKKEISILSGQRDVEIVAVSKGRTIDEMNIIRDYGFTHFGENRAQEVRDKENFFSDETITLSFIGKIQKNKIKYLADNCSLIQSIDSFDTGKAVSDIFEKFGKKIDVLIEVNSSFEESKGGVYPEDTMSLWKELSGLKNLNLKGLMTIGPNTAEKDIVEKSFLTCSCVFKEIEKEFKNATILSMGMSDDYKIALNCGSNMLRLGRILFEYDKYGVLK